MVNSGRVVFGHMEEVVFGKPAAEGFKSVIAAMKNHVVDESAHDDISIMMVALS